MYYSSAYLSPLGKLTMACDGEGLTGLWIEGQKYFGGAILEGAVEREELPLFLRTQDWLNRYFAGEKPDSGALPLHPIGSAFRREVWSLLREIPYGALTTYGALAAEMARRMGRSTMSSQAVGGAVGHNPLSILIPCHRVVGAHGSLTGYAGGIEKKMALLKREGVELSWLSVPVKGTAL